jgi:putative DNA primase/helicase
MADPFAPLDGERSTRGAADEDAAKWLAVMPVPENAPKPPERHPRLGKPSAIWTYPDARGRLLGFIYRFDATRKKEFRPLALFQLAAGGLPEWRWESWPSPRPLYGLDRLAAKPDATVVICEGEKAADAAQRLLSDCVCVTSPNGSKGARKADWTPLAGRRVILWPDDDQAGDAYAEAVAELVHAAGASSVAIVAAPANVVEGWDAADAEAQGWTSARTGELIAGARPFARPDAPATKRPKKERRKPQRDSLHSLCDCVVLWHSPDGEGFATVPLNGHCENWPLRSRAFRRWVTERVYTELGTAPGSQALEDLLNVLEAKAYVKGPKQCPWGRVGARGGRHYIDLGDPGWRVIEIRPNGWDVISGEGLPFVRSPRKGESCEPEAGYSVEELLPFVNVASDDFVLIVAWLVAALRDRPPYPVLLFTSEHGSGKTTLVRLLRSLVDPSVLESQGPPSSERDLIVSAQNTHVIALDNMSHLSSEFGDAIARISCGVGSAYRMLHTDREENIFAGGRPFILCSIPAITEKRADVNDRSLVIHLPSILDNKRRPEDELNADWEIARPRVLGALCTALSSALRMLGETRLERYGRMADFEKFMNAAEPGLGWEPGTFSAAYEANRRDAAGAAFEADVIAVAIGDFIRKVHQSGWSGTATELLDCLVNTQVRGADGLLVPMVSESVKRSKEWPTTAQGLGNRIRRAKPLLRQHRGIIVEHKHSGERTITIVPEAREVP